MRLDVYIAGGEYGLTRTEAKRYILEGAVTVNGKTVTKPAFEIDGQSVTVCINLPDERYVSRGGLKLAGALRDFNISVSGRDAVDIGASTGGFTDCLLQNGARRVVAVDSGTAQLVDRIADDGRVFVMENTNARYLTPTMLPIKPSLAVMDVSFISATCIIPAVYGILDYGSDFICLIKPQFEVGRSMLGKGGIVKDSAAHALACKRVIDFALDIGFTFVAQTTSSITGGDGNKEFFAHFRKEVQNL